MPTVDVVDLSNQKVGEVELADAVFGAEINKALLSPAVSQALAAASLTPEGGTPERFTEHVRKETEKLGKLIKSIGIKPQ